MSRHFLFTAALLPIIALPALAQTAPPPQIAAPVASAGWNTLDDEAEAIGFDLSFGAQQFPVEWMLAEQENGDGYILRFAPEGITLSEKQNGKVSVLAQRNEKPIVGEWVVQRRGRVWRIIAGKRIWFESENGDYADGKIAWRGKPKSVSNIRVQPVEDIAFDDDFMRVKEDVAFAQAVKDPHKGIRISDVKDGADIWQAQSGKWETTGLSENAEAQVAQSVNAFAFKTAAPGVNLAFAGRPFWNDYSVQAAARPEGATAIGIVAYAQDKDNYLLLHWTRRDNVLDTESGKIELRANVRGQMRVLASAPGGFEDLQWYNLRLSIEGGVMRAFVDDNEMLRTRTNLFGRGQAGVYAETKAVEGEEKSSAFFDDVRVRSEHDLHEDFSDYVPGRWQTLSGKWDWKGAATPETGLSQAVTGQSDWENYTVSARLKVPATSSAGLLLHQSKDGVYTLRIGGSKSTDGFAGRTQIIKTLNGKNQVLAEIKSGSEYDNRESSWSFSENDDYLRASNESGRVIDAFDTDLTMGRPGILASAGQNTPARIAAWSVTFPEKRPTWAKVPELYEAEQQAETMGGWSTPEGFWLPARPVADGAPAPVVKTDAKADDKKPDTLWHKGAFWGDGQLKFQVPALTDKQQFAVLLASGRQTPEVKLQFRIENNVLKLALQGDDKAKATTGEAKLEGKPTDYNVEVQQRGSYLIARLEKTSGEDRKVLLATRAF